MATELPDPRKAELDALLALPPAEARAAFENLLERWPEHADEHRRRWAAAEPVPRDTDCIRKLVFGALGARRHALRIQLAFDAGFATGVLPGLTHEQLRSDTRRNAMAFTSYPDLDPVEWDLAFNAALFCQSHRVALLIATEWRRQHEDSVAAIKAEADLLARRGELLRARQLAQEALSIDVALPWAKELRGEVDRVMGK